jgi:N6-adenosine-specific RNA methylase IME4
MLPKRGEPVSAEMLVSLERRLAVIIPETNDIAQLEEWRAQARALEQYLRDKDLKRPMLAIQRRVEARIGQLLGPTSRGKRGDLTLGHDLKSISDPGAREDFRILANGLSPSAALTDNEWRKSRRALVAHLRQKLGLLPPTPDLPEGKFRLIVADPPWKLDTGPDMFGGTGESGHDELAYRQMPLDAIKALPVEECAADDAHLYLWTTNRYVEPAYDIARAWGFRPSVMLVWVKTPRGVGLGDAYRITTEFCLYCRRGKLDERRIIPTTWFNWPRGRHSRKPDEFYEMVETVGHDPRLEMFAREQREGWAVWGDEAPVSEVSDASAGFLPNEQ